MKCYIIHITATSHLSVSCVTLPRLMSKTLRYPEVRHLREGLIPTLFQHLNYVTVLEVSLFVQTHRGFFKVKSWLSY